MKSKVRNYMKDHAAYLRMNKNPNVNRWKGCTEANLYRIMKEEMGMRERERVSFEN